MPSVFHVPVNDAIADLGARVAAARSAGAPTVTVVDGALYGTTFPIFATAARAGVTLAIFEVTGRTGNDLTVSGAVDGTTDVALQVDDAFEPRPTRGALTEVHDAIHNLEAIGWTGTEQRWMQGDGVTGVRLSAIGDGTTYIQTTDDGFVGHTQTPITVGPYAAGSLLTFAGDVTFTGALAILGIATAAFFSLPQFPGNGGIYNVTRRDTGAVVYGLYSAAGDLAVYDYTTGGNALTIAATTHAATFAGAVTAPSFHGDGSALTGLTSGQVAGLGSAALASSTSFAAAVHTHAAADVVSGTLAVSRIGSGTPLAGTYVDGGTGAWTALSSGSSVEGTLRVPNPFTRLAAGAKLAGFNVQPYAAQGNSWTPYWTDWPWATYIQRDLDLGIALGLNAVRVIGSARGVVTGAYTRAAYLAKWDQFLAYATSNGLYVYATAQAGQDLATGDDMTALVGEIVAWASHVAASPCVVAIDLIQEAESAVSGGAFASNAAFWSWASGTLNPAVRAAIPVAVPITYSQYGTDLNSSWEAGIAPSCDFLDYHPYAAITARDIAPTLAAHPTKAIVFGEFGGTMGSLTTRRQVINDINALSQHPNVLGAMVWVMSEDATDPTVQYGLYDGTGAVRDSQSIAILAPSQSTRSGLVLLDPSSDYTISDSGVWHDMPGAASHVNLSGPVAVDAQVTIDGDAPASTAAIARVVVTLGGVDVDPDPSGQRTAIVYPGSGDVRATMSQTVAFSLAAQPVPMRLLVAIAIGAGPVVVSSLNTRAHLRITPLSGQVTTGTAPDLSGKLSITANLSDLANAPTARTNLGLGTAATHAATDFPASISLATPSLLYASPVTFTNTSGAFAGTLTLNTQAANSVLAGPTTGAAAEPTFRALVAADMPSLAATYATRANNLSDLASAATARTNLGLGTMAVQAAAAVAITGGSVAGIALNEYDRPFGAASVAAGGTATLDLTTRNDWVVTLNGTGTLAFAGDSGNQPITLKVLQNATGGFTLTWPGTVTWYTSTFAAPTLAAGANKATYVLLRRTGTGTYDGFLAGASGA